MENNVCLRVYLPVLELVMAMPEARMQSALNAFINLGRNAIRADGMVVLMVLQSDGAIK